MAKHLIEAGLDVTVYEIGTQVGGLWCYKNDSGRSSGLPNAPHQYRQEPDQLQRFQVPRRSAAVPSHWEMHAYLEEYAEHFGVMERIKFKSEIKGGDAAVRAGHRRPEVGTGDRRRPQAGLQQRLRLHGPSHQCRCTSPNFRTIFRAIMSIPMTTKSRSRSSASGSASWVSHTRLRHRQRCLCLRETLRPGCPHGRLDRAKALVRRRLHRHHRMVHEGLGPGMVPQPGAQVSHLVRARRHEEAGPAADHPESSPDEQRDGSERHRLRSDLREAGDRQGGGKKPCTSPTARSRSSMY